MATHLTKEVRRQLASCDRKGRPLIVTLSPGDIITFRPKGAKRSVSCYIGHCFTLAQIATIGREYSDRIKTYKEAKAIGKRARRPVKPMLPFGKMYFDAMK